MKLVFKNQSFWVAALCLGILFSSFTPGPREGNQPSPQQVQPDPNGQDYTKTIKKEFPLNANGTVNLVNKYGKIDVKTWDKNRAKIDVTIVVKAGSESQAQTVFDRIRIDFSNDDSFVKAETIIESNKSSWFNLGYNERTEFQINYQVYMPATAALDLSNKYGDATVAPLTSRVKMDVKYGSFQLDGVGANLTLNLDYGNGTVMKSGDAAVNVSYSKLKFYDVRNVNLTSKYSKLTVTNGADVNAESRYDEFDLVKVARLDCTSKYGNLTVGSAESIKATGQYTDYKIDQLRDNGDFDLMYGGLRIDHVSKGFSKINLVGKYADFKIGVEDGASYTLDANASFAGIAYPTGLVVTYEKEKGTSHEVKGHAGTQNARSAIRANLNYGGLKVKQ
ncbi:MAG: hypothetical protein K9J37_14135 [Saprospiraceae bacterium]|nr:hypothetical protein [Saprospiraceae bacterium]MCF8251045.1 hypothetical protein [Saprospiraceae bacterium]MCF8280330.1 hypothetical protein [Bacteroidales bacterium]MCF8312899.1 hypothetical protein [Saprospiraceae bacterium]MCF8441304.1 hypothetical protein [Saprospiraceae bacterium]